MSKTITHSVGDRLLEAMKDQAKEKDVSQIVVVSGHHDEPKKEFLESQELRVASVWYVGEVG